MYNGLKVGDTVKIVRRAATQSNGWENNWYEEGMAPFISNEITYKITGISEYGARLQSPSNQELYLKIVEKVHGCQIYDFLWSWDSLEKCKRPRRTKQEIANAKYALVIDKIKQMEQRRKEKGYAF